jgi:RNA polymerase sigma factor (sigma-70 family)
MTDYRLVVKIKNHRLLKAIEDAGFKTVNAFCQTFNLSAVTVGQLVNLKTPALLKNGEWASMALQIADALLADPEDLFSEAQKTMSLKRNEVHRTYSEVQMLSMMDDSPEMLLMIEDSHALAHQMLESLTPRQQRVLELRFGMNDKESCTYREISKLMDVSVERVRQIELGALRQIRAEQKRAGMKVVTEIEEENETLQDHPMG